MLTQFDTLTAPAPVFTPVVMDCSTNSLSTSGSIDIVCSSGDLTAVMTDPNPRVSGCGFFSYRATREN